MSAGTDGPARAAGRGGARSCPGRVSIITSVGCCGFVGGPPLIGFPGNNHRRARPLVIAILIPLSTAIAGTTRRSPGQRTQSGFGTQARTADL